jgi:hypothetical protein
MSLGVDVEGHHRGMRQEASEADRIISLAATDIDHVPRIALNRVVNGGM